MTDLNVRSIRRVIRFSRSCGMTVNRLSVPPSGSCVPLSFIITAAIVPSSLLRWGVVLTDHRYNLSLLCYQTGGVSDLLEVEGWVKLHRVSDMDDIEVLKEHFSANRSGYEPQNLETPSMRRRGARSSIWAIRERSP